MKEIVEGNVILGRYRVLTLLGEGIHGKVFKAWDSLREDTIALKVLHADVVAAWGGLALIRPVLSDICRLHHPNISSVFDFQLVETQIFLCQEYVEGQSLKTLLEQGGPLSDWKLNSGLGPQIHAVAQALAYASEICPHGHVHPGQIVITSNGQIRITDFGLARLWQGNALRNIARFHRTFQYLEPTSVNENESEFWIRRDQFSFCMLLAELNRVPWSGINIPISLTSIERFSIFQDRLGLQGGQGRSGLPVKPWKELIDEVAPRSLTGIGPSRSFALPRVKHIASGIPSKLVWALAPIVLICLILIAIEASVKDVRDASRVNATQLLMKSHGQLRVRFIELATANQRWLNMALKAAKISEPNVLADLNAKWQFYLSRGDYAYANHVLEDLEGDLAEEMAFLQKGCDSMQAVKQFEALQTQYINLSEQRNPTPAIIWAVDSLRFLYHHRENQTSRSPSMTQLVAHLTEGLGNTKPLLPAQLEQPDSPGVTMETLDRHIEQGLFGRAHAQATAGIQMFEQLFHNWNSELTRQLDSSSKHTHELMVELKMKLVPKPPYPEGMIAQAREAFANHRYEEGTLQLLEALEVYEAWENELSDIPSPEQNQKINSIGMRFIPLENLWVSIWETRICDFNSFIYETGTDSRRLWRENSDPIAWTHPVVSVERYDAIQFCRWLTDRERSLGMIAHDQEYRLPTDREWSLMVDLSEERGETPESRSWHDIEQYPWGNSDVRTPGSGNYVTWPSASHQNSFFGKMDPWKRTSPVGSFNPNQHGLYDLGGNVWEMVSDPFNEIGHHPNRTLRGGSWRTLNLHFMRSNYRHAAGQNGEDIGFRVVIASVGKSLNQSTHASHD